MTFLVDPDTGTLMRSTRRSHTLTGLATLVLAAGIALPATAQGRGDAGRPLDRALVSTTRPLSSEQQAQVKAFADAQLEALAQGDAEDMIAARDAIIQDARRPGVTGVFLRAFSSELVPGIDQMLQQQGDGMQTMRAENGLRILTFLRTPEALEIIVSTTNPVDVKDDSRRLVAAGLLPIAVEAVPQSGLGSAVLTSTARRLSEHLVEDANWIVVLEDLRAMNAIALNRNLTKENRAEVREMQFNAYARLANGIASSDTPSPIVKAIYRAMLGLRERLLDNSTAGDISNRQIANTLREMLKRIGSAAVRQWNGLEADPAMFQAYEGTLRVGAQLLSLLERRQDPKINALAAPMTAVAEKGDSSDQALTGLKAALKNLG